MISLDDDNFPELREATTQQVLCGYNIIMKEHMCETLLKICNNWDKKQQIGMIPQTHYIKVFTYTAQGTKRTAMFICRRVE